MKMDQFPNFPMMQMRIEIEGAILTPTIHGDMEWHFVHKNQKVTVYLEKYSKQFIAELHLQNGTIRGIFKTFDEALIWIVGIISENTENPIQFECKPNSQEQETKNSYVGMLKENMDYLEHYASILRGEFSDYEEEGNVLSLMHRIDNEIKRIEKVCLK